MVARSRTWLSLGAGVVLAVAGCRTGSPPLVADQHLVSTPVAAQAEPPAAHVQLHVKQAAFHEAEQVKPPDEKPPKKPLGERLQLPPGLPGRDAPEIKLPEKDPERKAYIDRTFPALPTLPEPVKPAPGPDGRPLTLADLQGIAQQRNPVIRQAAANVEVARGVAVQAGLYPNPRAGYQGDSINQGSTAGSQGGFVEQTIKTGGKLQLARSAAEADVDNAELALRRTQVDLSTHVRKGYFSFLVAQRAYTVSRAFATLTAEVYAIQVTRLRLGQAAVYEPLQARVLALQARAALLQAENRLLSAWRQLAAGLGEPGMPLTDLAGNLDAAVPRYLQADVLARVLARHTDVLTAQVGITRAQLLLRLAEVTPRPDIDLHYQLQYDKTASPNNAMHGVTVGVLLPLWDRNQGNIRSAQATLSRATDEPARVRNDLTAQVAAAFERYDSNRSLVLLYRDQIVPDQVRAYEKVYRRYDTEPDVLNFNDVITAQQTLAQTIRDYVEAIGNLWDAVTDIANLLQVNDLYEDGTPGPDMLDECPIPPLQPLPAPKKKKHLRAEATVPDSGIQQVGCWTESPGAIPALGGHVPFEVRPLPPRRLIPLRARLAPE